jgi:hypothetical protein
VGCPLRKNSNKILPTAIIVLNNKYSSGHFVVRILCEPGLTSALPVHPPGKIGLYSIRMSASIANV